MPTTACWKLPALAGLLSVFIAAGCVETTGYGDEEDMGRPPGSIDIPKARWAGRPPSDVLPQEPTRDAGSPGEERHHRAQAESAEAPPQAP